MASYQKNSIIISGDLSPEAIPLEELFIFKPYIKKINKGEKLISEGDNEKTLYLLRKGTVGIYRNIEGIETLLTFIEAVNFIGEMEFFTETARISTVRAFSDEIVVYSFSNPDLTTMLCNKDWGLKILRRLSSDLKMFSDRAIELETEIKLLRQKLAATKEELQ